MDSSSTNQAPQPDRVAEWGQQALAGPDSATDRPVKYTPVTGRVSRAKEGVAVYDCDICSPAKTFTRKEHLRRHQLSHQKPAHPCIFKDCERVFHRSDLLARHLNRHETQGEKPYKSPGVSGIEVSQGLSESKTSPHNIGAISGGFQAANFSPGPSSQKRSASEAQLPGADPYSGIFLRIGTPPAEYDNIISGFPATSKLNLTNQGNNERPIQQGNGGMYSEESNSNFTNVNTSHDLPLLRIPEEKYIPSIAYSQDNSPWYSSASDSNYSTESEGSPQMTSLESVGTPAVLTYNKLSPQNFRASHSRLSEAGQASINRQQKVQSPQQLDSLNLISTMNTSCPTPQQLDIYILTYWNTFDRLFPIIHRGTFDPAEDTLLTSAMAAIACQYHHSAEARQNGIELNKYCIESIDHFPTWNLHTMQAILLTETFTRFRGRKTNVQLSKQFEELYSRLLTSSSQDQASYSGHSSAPVSLVNADTLLDHFISPYPSTQHHNSDLQDEWIEWIEIEARQRLLSSCFIFDVHQSIYHEQNRSKANINESNLLLFLPCHEKLWNASCASEWEAQKTDFTMKPLFIVEQELSTQYLATLSPFARTLFTCSLARQLLPRKDPRYPNNYLPKSIHPTVANLRTFFSDSPLAHTYLALYYTPLHDLLAIAGDTWVFSRKVTPSAFYAAQARLKTWSASLAAAAATQHACHILCSLAFPQQQYNPSDGAQSGGMIYNISDYWAWYTSALICWAFGHRYQSSSSESSSAIPGSSFPTIITASIIGIDSPQSPTDEGRLKALTYIDEMLHLSIEELLTGKATMRGETSGVIDLVRARLESENAGGKCMLLVDAVYVLTRIKESGRARFFSGSPSEGLVDSYHSSPALRISEEDCIPNFAELSQDDSSRNLTPVLATNPESEHNSRTSPTALEVESNGSSDTSAGFETDSSYSEDEVHEKEAHNTTVHRYLDVFKIIHNELISGNQNAAKDLIRPILTPMKQAIVGRVMKEFWVIFNQEWSSNVRKCAGDAYNKSSSAKIPETSPSGQHVLSGSKKRVGDNDHDQDRDEEEGKNPKRPRKQKSVPEDRIDGAKFACPYRKHDPRKYTIRSWRVCALTPLDSVSRVKGHLYRHHRVFQCQRCKDIFQTPEDLDAHFVAVTSCELRLTKTAEGITSTLEKQLRNRKKACRNETEEERWKRIYEILFPMEPAPSPYFEPIEDDPALSPDSRELAQFEEFSRQELPRFFRTALEAAVNEESQLMEEQLKSRLVDMIRDCQDRVISTYKSKFASSSTALTNMLPHPSFPSNPDKTPRCWRKQTMLASDLEKSQGDDSLEILESFYEDSQSQNILQMPSAIMDPYDMYSDPLQTDHWQIGHTNDSNYSTSSSSKNVTRSLASISESAPSFYEPTQCSYSVESQGTTAQALEMDSAKKAPEPPLDFSFSFPLDELVSLFPYESSLDDYIPQ